MNASFGIDHPLLATHDIQGLRDRLISLGFNMTAIGKHPWGTSTSLAMFNGCLIEIMGVYDDTLLDMVPAGDFRFGRHVYDHLQLREGAALSALHSTNSDADARYANDNGFEIAGHLEFGRDVVLPDGNAGRTKTTLALLPDSEFPRLSFFLCHQHRPELVYVPEWLEHPNKVTGIAGVNVLAAKTYHDRLLTRLGGLYGAHTPIGGGFQMQTANGVIRVLEPDAFEQRVGPLPVVVDPHGLPSIVGMDLTMTDPATLETVLQKSNMGYRAFENGFALTEPARMANTILRFVSS